MASDFFERNVLNQIFGETNTKELIEENGELVGWTFEEGFAWILNKVILWLDFSNSIFFHIFFYKIELNIAHTTRAID